MLGSHVFARVGPVWLMALMPYVTDEAHARSRPIAGGRAPALVASAHGAALLVAGLILVPNAAFGLVVAFSTVVPVSAFAAWRFHARAGGSRGTSWGLRNSAVKSPYCSPWYSRHEPGARGGDPAARHAAVAEEWRGRCYGRTDVTVDVTDEGAARLVLDGLSGAFEAVWSSPLARCHGPHASSRTRSASSTASTFASGSSITAA